MTGDEAFDFVREKPRPAIAAVVLADGRPHATPVCIDVDGEELVFTSWHETLKARALKRDPRISLCVQDDQPPFSFVTIEGSATLVEDMDELKKWAGRIGGRYMGPAKAAAYGERNGVPGEHLVRVHVTRIVGDRDVAA